MKYWYKFYIGECPVCGYGDGYKERVYGPKPGKKEERYSYSYEYCGCTP